LGLSSVGMGAFLPASLPGSPLVAHAEELTEWQFNPDTQQLEVVVPENSTPRYFLLAQPARIVLDLPNTDVGTTISEQSYAGAVRRVRVAQFEPGVTRIVLELTPDAVLAPGQAELTQVETLPGGATRWTLRPLLAGGGSPEENLAVAPVVEESAVEDPVVDAIEDPVVDVLPDEPVVAEDLAGDQVAEVEEGAIAPQPSAPEPIPDLAPSEEVFTPEPDALPTEPTDEELLDPFSAEALPGEEPVIAEEPVTEFDAIAPQPPDPTPLGTEESPLISQGAEFLQTEPASLPLIQSSVGEQETVVLDSSVAINPDEEANAIAIPIDDFPTPTELPPSEAEVAATPDPMALPPATDEPTESATITVPPIEADPAPSPAPEIAAAPIDPTLLIPSGTTLQLRYPRTTPLSLEEGQVWQEVLVLTEPIQDAQGNILLPGGSEILGRFEAGGRGSRFVAQAIAIDGQVILFEAESERVRGDRQSPRTIAPNQIIEVEVEQDVRR